MEIYLIYLKEKLIQWFETNVEPAQNSCIEKDVLWKHMQNEFTGYSKRELLSQITPVLVHMKWDHRRVLCGKKKKLIGLKFIGTHVILCKYFTICQVLGYLHFKWSCPSVCLSSVFWAQTPNVGGPIDSGCPSVRLSVCD